MHVCYIEKDLEIRGKNPRIFLFLSWFNQANSSPAITDSTPGLENGRKMTWNFKHAIWSQAR